MKRILFSCLVAALLGGATIAHAANGVTWNSINLPSTGTAGQTITFTANVTNSGGAMWGGNHYLELKDSGGTPLSYVSVSGTETSASTTVSFALTLPSTTGSYTYSFKAYEYDVEYFGSTQTRTITVSGTANSIPSVTLPVPSQSYLWLGGSLSLSSVASDADGGLVTHTLEYLAPNSQTWVSASSWNGSATSSHTINYSQSSVAIEGAWQFRARGIDSQGAFSPYAYQTVFVFLYPDETSPTVPTSLQASSITATSFTLSWTASQDNSSVLVYEVKEVASGTSLGLASGTSRSITGLAPSTTYTYVVRARDYTNYSIWSQPFSVTTATGPVASFTITPEYATSSATISYNASASSSTAGTITSYSWDFDVNGTTDSTSVATSRALSAVGTYLTKLTITDSAGKSANITRAVYLTDGLAGSLNSSGTIHSDYEDEEGYHEPTSCVFYFTVPKPGRLHIYSTGSTDVCLGLFYKNASGATATAGDEDGASPNFDLTLDVGPGDCMAIVEGQHTYDDGNFGIIADFLPVDDVAPTTPTNLLATSVTATSFTVSWTAATDNMAVTGYEIYANGVSQGTTTGTSKGLTGLSAGTFYSVTVRARDARANWSPLQSSPLLVTTALTAPTSLTAAVVTMTSVALTWTASTEPGVTEYQVFEGSSTTPIRTVAASKHSVVVTNLSAGSTHTYTVKAVGVNNVSVASSSLSVTTLSNTDTDADGVPDRVETLLGTQTGTSNSTDNSSYNLKVHKP